MKFFLCLLTVFVAGAAAVQVVEAKAETKINLRKLLNPTALKHVREFKALANNMDPWDSRKQINTVHDFVDMIISEVRYFLVNYGFDPMKLPAIDEEIVIADTPIHLVLNDGVIFNASSIYRDGDVNIDYENRIITTEIAMFFKLFKMNYNYDIEVGSEASNITLLQGQLNGEVNIVDVKFSVQVDFRKLEISLNSFEITNMGIIDAKFEGSMLNWLLQGLTDYITSELKEEVIAVVEAVSAFTLETVFDLINKLLEAITP